MRRPEHVTPNLCAHGLPKDIPALPCLKCEKEKKARREALKRVQAAAKKLDW